MGDPVRTLLMAKQNEIIFSQNLMDNANKTGEYFRDELNKIA